MNSSAVFLYRLQLTPKYTNTANWNADTEAVINQHVAFLDDLGRQGILLLAGRTLFEPGDDQLFGIALIKADSLQQAKTIMADDPTVVNQIHQAELLPFSLALSYFENLNG